MFRISFLLPIAVLAIGCASRNPQTDEFFATQAVAAREIPPVHEIKNVPFVLQKVAHCGPATLTMAMNWWGKSLTVDEIAAQVYSPKSEGSFQTDMVSAVRRNGMLGVPIFGLEALTREIAADHPVIVFENLGLASFPLWHYALVFGYDLPDREFILHSGKDAGLRESFKVFERSWKLGDYWGLVILPPGQLAVTADEFEHVKAASALEQLELLPAADESYQAILKRWPESLGALIGRANIAFTQRRKKDSLGFLLQATKFHPNSSSAWHNLAIAQAELKQRKAARTSAANALRLASPEEKSQFEKSLKELR